MIRQEHSAIPVAAGTHAGMKGKNNEDRYAVSAFTLNPLDRRPVLLAVLSDGIGGHRAGEVASTIAVNRISQMVAASDASRPVETLIEAIQAASREIQSQAGQNHEQSGMGATCACAWIIGDRLYTATVGDSRIYLLRNGHIRQLSTDHTWIQDALEQGLLRPDQTAGHPNAHVIRRYLGSPVVPDVDVRLRFEDGESDAKAVANQGAQLQPGDRLVLTSDGLTDLVQNDEILKAYLEQTPEAATQMLIDLANTRGGHDNITLVTFQVPPRETSRERLSRQRSKWILGCAGLLVVLGLVGAVAGGVWWAGRRVETATPTPSQTAAASLLDATTTTVVTTAPQSTATPLPAAPTTTLTAAPLLPVDSGPTLTPWPTYTPRP
jgi:PPM family protein phosphatase